MADNKQTDAAVSELGHGVVAGDTFVTALHGDIWDKWTAAVKAAALPHPDKPDEFDETPQVPIVQYGSGPHDYISTDIDSGQVMVRDGNDPGGKAWKFPAKSFYRFAAKLRGEKLADDDEQAEGMSMYEGAKVYAERTAKKVEADEKATPDNKADRPKA